jgi:hypothetical protein
MTHADWRPIGDKRSDEAPWDGKPVLLAHDKWVYAGFWFDGGQDWCTYGPHEHLPPWGENGKPTHWVPYPSVPSVYIDPYCG